MFDIVNLTEKKKKISHKTREMRSEGDKRLKQKLTEKSEKMFYIKNALESVRLACISFVKSIRATQGEAKKSPLNKSNLNF